MRKFWMIFVVLWCFVAPVNANTEAENGAFVASMLEALADKDWELAQVHARQISDPIGMEFVTWERLRNNAGTFDEYIDFLSRNDDWPGLKRLRRQGERKIPNGYRASSVRSYFADQLPQTGAGSLRLIEAYVDQGRGTDAKKEAIRAWRYQSLTEVEQDWLLENYGKTLERYHVTRLDNLLWSGRTSQVERMLGLVTKDFTALARARRAVQQSDDDLEELLSGVPDVLADDAGLGYDRFMYRIKNGLWDEAEALLIEHTGAKSMGQAEKWGSRRRGFARRAMRAGNTDLAYKLASQHGLLDGSNYADLEWLSGYLSLQKMGKPERALLHFQNFQRVVSGPISLGRAGYWTGRAQEALGQTDAAALSYAIGAQYQTSFYGQLSAEKVGVIDETLAGLEVVPDWRLGPFVDTGPWRMALLLHYAGDKRYMRWFLTHIAESLDREGLAQLTNLVLELDRPHIALKIAKQAANTGYIIPKAYFPVTDLAGFSSRIDPEIAMAIARRESELDASVSSSVGAQGLMQVMPGTAQDVAEDLGLEYSKERLSSDWRYNATLGTSYLAGLLEAYNGSYILAFTAYNAGPGRVSEWIEIYGDPRADGVDKIDWIEHIPYRETRNYVMRVMESLHVYRARIEGRPQPVQLTADLNRG